MPEPVFLANGKVEANRTTLMEWSPKLGIEIGKRPRTKTMVEKMRDHFDSTMVDGEGKPIPKDTEAWIVCEKCGEYTDETPDVCPFCGDDGGAETAAPTEPIEEAAAPTPVELDSTVADALEEAETPEVLPAVSTDALDQSVQRIKELENDFYGNGYDLGTELRKVQQGELWKARGHSSFSAFLKAETHIAKNTAYGLIHAVDSFSREQFLKVGPTKLALAAKIDDPKKRAEVVKKAEEGATKEEVRAEVRKSQGKDTPSKPSALEKGTAGRPKKEDQTITLLAKVGGSAKTYPFEIQDGEETKPVDAYEKGAFAKIQLSDDVVMFVGLKVKKDTITAVQVAFTRADS